MRLDRLRAAGLLLALLAPPGSAQEVRPIFQTYLSVNEVRAVAAEEDRLWLATMGGGVLHEPATGRFETFHRSTGGLLSDSLTTVAVAPDGRIWFGSEKAGISILDPLDRSWESFTSLHRPIPGDRIRRIRFAGDTLFVSAEQGFAVFVSGDQVAVCQEGIDDLRCRLPSYDVRDLAGDPAGNGFWIATAVGVAHHDSGGTTTTYSAGPASPAAGPLLRHRGAWICAFPDGAYRLDPLGGVWEPLGGPSGAGAVADLVADGDRLLAAGAGGVWQLDPAGEWTRLGGQALPATSAAVDRAGRLWAGARDPAEASNGIWELLEGQWRRTVFPGPSLRAHYRALAFGPTGDLTLSHAAPATAPMIQTLSGGSWLPPVNVLDWTFDLLHAPGGDLWLAQCCCRATGCALRLLSDGTLESGPPRNLRDLSYDPDGNLWCASDHAPDNEEYAEGIWFLRAGTSDWTQITVATPGASLLRNRVRAILPLGRVVWIGYSDRGVHRWDLGPDQLPLTADDGEWTRYSTEEVASRRLLSDEVTRLAAQGGRVWVGTTAGITLVDPASVTQVGSGFFGLPSPVVNDLIPLRDGGAWVATAGAGITRMSPEGTGFRFETYGPPDLPHPNTEALALDPDGRTLWAATTRGLCRVSPAAGGEGAGEPLVAYPNPFVPGCGEGVRLLGFSGVGDGVVVDLSGRVVRRLENLLPGERAWDGTDRTGALVAPGLYWIRLASPEGTRGVGVGIGDGPCAE